MDSNATILNDIVPHKTVFSLIFLKPQFLHFFSLIFWTKMHAIAFSSIKFHFISHTMISVFNIFLDINSVL